MHTSTIIQNTIRDDGGSVGQLDFFHNIFIKLDLTYIHYPHNTDKQNYCTLLEIFFCAV